MTDQEKEVYRPGAIKLEGIQIWNFKKDPVILTDSTIEFNIYQDLYGKGTKIELVIVDSNGLIEMLPIVGDEHVAIKFKTPTFDTTLTHVFRIYKISDRRKAEPRAEVYTLHGVSQEIISDKRKTINKSYSQLLPEKIIESIYEDYLRPTEEEYGIVKAKQPELELQETQFNLSFCFPSVRPFQAIQQVCNEAVLKVDENESEPKSKSENFVFYHTPTKWVFKTLDSLLRQDPVDKFYFAEASKLDTKKGEGEGDETGIYPHQHISNLEIKKQLDTVENLEQGLYAHVVKTIDPLLKRFTNDAWSYNNDFDSMTHIEDDPKVYADESIYASDAGTSVSHYIVSNIGEDYQNTNDFTKRAVEADTDFQITNPRNLHSFMKYMVASSSQLTNLILEIVIPGNTDIEIGNIIEIHVPQTSDFEDYKESNNLLWGGKFLITAVRHTYNKKNNHFFSVLSIVKDSYAKDSVKCNAKEA
jgi:hypothetical protein